MRLDIVFALFALGLLGLNDFLYKWGQRWELRSGPFMLVQNLAFIPTAFLAAHIRGELFWTPSLLLGYLNGLVAFTAFLFLFLAMRGGAAVAIAPIVRLNFAVTSLLAFAFLGEMFTPTKVAALILAVGAVSAGGFRAFGERGGRRHFGLAVSSMCLLGFMGVFYKLGIRLGAPPAALTAAQSLGVFSMALPFAIYAQDPIPRGGGPFFIPVVCGVITSLSFVSFAVALSYGEAMVVAPIAQLSFVLTGILAIFFLREKVTAGIGAGIVLAVLSVLLFAQS